MSTVNVGIVSPVIKGAWDITEDYNRLNIVHHSDGATYQAIQAVSAEDEIDISNTSYWMQITPKTPTIGTVTDVAFDAGASVTNSGTALAPVLDFEVPRGVTGNESIDDTAGEGDDDVVWSADKAWKEDDKLHTYITDMDALPIKSLPLTNGNLADAGTWNQLNSAYQHCVVPVKFGDVVEMKFDARIQIGFVKSYSTPVNGASVDYSTAEGFASKKILTANTGYSYTVPSDCKYIIVEYKFQGTKANILIFKINDYDYTKSVSDNFDNIYSGNVLRAYRGFIDELGLTTIHAANLNGFYRCGEDYLENLEDKPDDLNTGFIVENFYPAAGSGVRYQIITDNFGHRWFRYGTNEFKRMDVIEPSRNVMWFALGDSITHGYTGKDGEIGPRTNNNYVKNVALLNGFTYVNYGEGGAGYLHNATVGSLQNAKGKVGDIDFSTCDLVTLAYGVNDWHYSMEIGAYTDDKDAGNTMCSNMKYVIEKILTDNPMCKIIVMTPINCSKYGGDFSTNWGMGYSLTTSGTLQHVTDAIISVCEYYGIEYIDQSKTSIVNRFNINDCLGDGIHPLAELYPILAKDLASKINMK